MKSPGQYRVVCAFTGFVAAWLPFFLHGPIPEKLDRVRLNGAIAVWGYYVARLLIGFVVGAATWPQPWWLRGPFFGALLMLPVGTIALATPGCGPNCMALNVTTGAFVGLLAGGAGWLVTGRSHA
jgi:hypothetical protein